MNKQTKKEWLDFNWIVVITVLHFPLGVLIYTTGGLSILHPLLVLCVGLYLALDKRFRLESSALAIAYLVGAEVLWRMAQVQTPWEFGKFGAAAIAITALLTRAHYTIPNLPLFYLAVLIPGCVLTLFQTDLSSAQEIFSAQMSGPFFLAIACWFFSYCRFDQLILRKLLFAITLPLTSVAGATLFFTIGNENIQFTGESSFATSGGFGPNQVSSMLGLGAFISLASLLIFKNEFKRQFYYMAATILFSAQAVMTFSRGGMYNTLGAILVVSLVAFRRPFDAVVRLAPVVILIIIFLTFVFPVLDDFTDGMLKERFEDTATTSRVEIASADLQLFLENPLFGVGVGASYGLREQFLDRKAMSHTEFSRLLSEHGIFGIAAIVILVCMIITNFRKQRAIPGRALVAGAAMWGCLFMTNTSMRLAAPSLMWGLMYSTIVFTGPKRLTTRPRKSKSIV